MQRNLNADQQHKITRNRPAGARAYFLTNSVLGRFPPDNSAWEIEPILTLPEDVPDGKYQVKYQATAASYAQVVPTSYVPTLEFKSNQELVNSDSAGATAAQSATGLSDAAHNSLMNEPKYRSLLIDHAKYDMALDLQMRQATLLHHVRRNTDAADQMRMNQFSRLEMQAMAGFVQELQTEGVRGSLTTMRAAHEVALAAQDIARVAREQLIGPPQQEGLGQVAMAGLDTLGRLLGRLPGPRAQDAPEEAIFGGDVPGSEDAQLNKELQQQTKAIREEIARLRKEAAAPKPPPTESPLLAEIKALRAEVERLQAAAMSQTPSSPSAPSALPAATQPTAQTAVAGHPAQPDKGVPAVHAAQSAKSVKRVKRPSKPAKPRKALASSPSKKKKSKRLKRS